LSILFLIFCRQPSLHPKPVIDEMEEHAGSELSEEYFFAILDRDAGASDGGGN
jgi:hypothetical protein